ncbi:biopolymer transporter ExbD [bacterium]|nr:biopolymer transporter ExbD [bacterium]
MEFRNVKRHIKPTLEIPTASLGDIVFLLLIFFLVTTSLSAEKGIGLTLPPPGEEVEVSSKNILNVYVNAAGKILVKGEIVELDNLEQIIREHISRNPRLIISLKTDEKAKYEYMIRTLDRIKLSGAKKISLAVPEF